MRVHEAAPGGAASERIRTRCCDYTHSYYGVADQPYEDLESLSFEDETIDLFITQDVFEHVLRPENAFREIARVLRPGGAHVFTVPIYDRRETLVRVDSDGTVLLDPDYHDSPEGPALVVREWGLDLPAFVDDATGLRTSVYVPKSRWHGVAGEFLDVLVSRKPSAIA